MSNTEKNLPTKYDHMSVEEATLSVVARRQIF